MIYGLSLGSCHGDSGIFFKTTRVYVRGYRWTPFVKIEKRYSKWLGFFPPDEKKWDVIIYCALKSFTYFIRDNIKFILGIMEV